MNIEGKRTRKGQVLAWRHKPLYADCPLAAWQGVLAARGLREQDGFFTPALADLPDPMTMRDMPKAATRLAHAIVRKEHVHVFGDFDCDGVSGTAILVQALRQAGAKVSSSIPHRANDGHGIGVEPVRRAKAAGASLGLSVDTGTTCLQACQEAKDLGLDLMITDHHLPADELPQAYALLNPARADCGFAERVLCGTGVAFFLLMATWKVLAEQGRRPAYDLRLLLDRVAMATVADVMPLVGVNRILVSFGLKQLRTRPSLGMAALLKIANIKPNRISVDSLGFYLAPRINAAGRMQHGEQAMQLLCCEDEAQAERLAKALDACNQERRKVEADTFKQAQAKLANMGEDGRDAACLAVYDQAWHAGVVGLVAGRLARQYGKPAAVGFVDGHGGIRVSLRGVKGFHIGEILQACAASMQGFGGHAGAGGGTIRQEDWQAFVQEFGQAVQAQMQGETQVTVAVDGVLRLSALHAGLAARLERFEPVGQGNPACLWVLAAVEVVDVQKLKGGVLRIRLHDDGLFAHAVAFGASALAQDLVAGQRVSLLGQLRRDEYRGGQATQFVIQDVLLSS